MKTEKDYQDVLAENMRLHLCLDDRIERVRIINAKLDELDRRLKAVAAALEQRNG